MLKLLVLNLVSRRSVVSPTGPVVSLTSYSKRVRFVFLAIESIARGRVRPSRFILWLDEDDAFDRPPASLRRLIGRGLEIRHTENFGPHKKYYPYVVSKRQHDVPLVLADDDLLYPIDWLSSLVEAARPHEPVVLAHRVHRVEVLDGDFAPYNSWTRGRVPKPSARHFFTGGSGVLLPPALLDHLRERGPEFQTCAATADDVWLNYATVDCGYRVEPVLHLEESDYGQTRGIGRHSVEPLYVKNVFRGGNDAQIAATYDGRVRAAVLADS
jgi:hypothetical protein